MSREISAFLSHFLVRPPLGAVQRLFGSHQGAVRCLRGFAARDCVHFLGDRHDFGASHRSRVLSRTAMSRVRGAGDAFGRFSFFGGEFS